MIGFGQSCLSRDSTENTLIGFWFSVDNSNEIILSNNNSSGSFVFNELYEKGNYKLLPNNVVAYKRSNEKRYKKTSLRWYTKNPGSYIMSPTDEWKSSFSKERKENAVLYIETLPSSYNIKKDQLPPTYRIPLSIFYQKEFDVRYKKAFDIDVDLFVTYTFTAIERVNKKYWRYRDRYCSSCCGGCYSKKTADFLQVESGCFRRGYLSGINFGKDGYDKKILSDYLKIKKDDIVDCIQLYVKTRINDWKLKGEFETSIEFQQRVNTHTRNEMLEQYLLQAIDHFKRERINLVSDQDISLTEYNADSQTFSIIITDFGSLNFPVPVSKARYFKETFNSSNFSKLDLSLKNNKFLVSHIEYKYKGEDVFIYDLPDNICSSGDCVNGYGVFTSEEGTYKGHWKDGKVHGNGVFDGILYNYNGEYLDGKKHGNGKKIYIDNYIEEGTFENGEFVGK